MEKFLRKTYILMNTCVYAYVSIYALLYAHTRIFIRTYAYTYTHIRVYLYAHTRIPTHIRVYLFAYHACILVNVYLSGTVVYFPRSYEPQYVIQESKESQEMALSKFNSLVNQ